MYNFLLCLYNCCCYFCQFLAFTSISKFYLKLLFSTMINKVHQKKHGNNKFCKWIGKNYNNNNNNNNWKKIGIDSLSGEKKSGKNTGRVKGSRGKISLGKNLVTCKKFSHFFPTFFSPIRYEINAGELLMLCIVPFLTERLIHNAYKHSVWKLRTIESFKKF